MNIFGVTIPEKNHAEVLEDICQTLSSNAFHRITTLNPEFLLLADEDIKFRENLNQADIRTIDGGGLRVAFWLQRRPWGGRVTGGEIVDLLCREAQQQNLKVGIVAREDGLSSLEEILNALRKKYPKVFCEGIAFSKDTRLGLDREKIRNCEIVFCNFGAPEQEYFIESLRENPGNIRMAVGVGGVFDVITGKMKKPPRWMAFCSLEWLWRLLQQPQRFRRIFRAVVVFPWRSYLSEWFPPRWPIE